MTGENDEIPPQDATLEETEGENDPVAMLKAEVEALRDRSLRALADAENTRKRAERERAEATQYAITRFARDLLNVADNLTRAMAACPPEMRNDVPDAFRAVIDGVEATERELQAVLQRHGVKPVAVEGERFDPHLHQAIAQVPAPGKESGTVVNVVQTGYTLNDRLLRPAMVTVAKDKDSSQPDGGEDSGRFDTTV